ncbi:MAG: beta-galactosidase [Kibdelosporangium sp.]
MRIVAALLMLPGWLPVSAATAAAPDTGRTHQVDYDRYSLTVDGRRMMLWSGEFHYFRLPSPQQWRDVLEKIKAAGFNGVSLYLHCGYHSPAPGGYDFTGVRDIDRLSRMTGRRVGVRGRSQGWTTTRKRSTALIRTRTGAAAVGQPR